ncbi:phospholipase/carboxylesterase [Amycolatopsis bartoniae]|uniref:Hydrolase n=1 Tax=Amycolatopsis bartoniae TaxID=941986 RepID=A0A8H9IZ79_9PSEU|nr:alpha/beta hydrolase [Amycolatopsis bartoniae]MBB2935047.1 phospholipase/carboxylesterase [Amycolatopsis bartoniae]TVT02528.1 alpha/beta hydrolase [Amycolatopsis bartoniae]GHF73942.1 hydrolase [Amycolatopsis bartoniae]
MTLEHEFVEGEDATPVLLLLHGTGGGPRDLMPLARELSPGSPMLAPQGPVNEYGAARWFRRLREGVFDYEDVVARANQLADFLGDARKRYGLTDRRLVAVGFSNGANIAGALTLLRPDVLTEAALFASMLPVPDPPQHDLTGTRVFLSNGLQDPMAPLPSNEEFLALLKERGADVTVHRHPGGHQITLDAVSEAKSWLTRQA